MKHFIATSIIAVAATSAQADIFSVERYAASQEFCSAAYDAQGYTTPARAMDFCIEEVFHSNASLSKIENETSDFEAVIRERRTAQNRAIAAERAERERIAAEEQRLRDEADAEWLNGPEGQEWSKLVQVCEVWYAHKELNSKCAEIGEKFRKRDMDAIQGRIKHYVNFVADPSIYDHILKAD